jgi:hypothetical protein
MERTIVACISILLSRVMDTLCRVFIAAELKNGIELKWLMKTGG